MAQDAHIIRWFLGFQNFLQSREEFAPLLPFTAIDPAAMRNPEAMRLKHIHASLQTLYSPAFEELAVRAVDAYARSLRQATTPIAEPGPDADVHAAAVRDRGFTKLPPLPTNITADMRRHFEASPLYADSTAREDSRTTFAEAEAVQNLAHYADRDILNCPHLLDIALNPLHLGLAQSFLGTVPMIITCAAWWSFARADEAREAQLYHLDLDDYRFLKLFVYLTDVDETSGPHVYVPTTHRADILLKAREAAPSIQQFDQWLGQLRKTDREVGDAFGIAPVEITGEAGTVFVANTRGIHKGLLPKDRNRLVCQIVYGMTPQRIKQDLPVAWSPAETPNIDRRYVEPPFDYVTQLYLKG